MDLCETFRILYYRVKVDIEEKLIKKEQQITEVYGLMPSPLATQLFHAAGTVASIVFI